MLVNNLAWIVHYPPEPTAVGTEVLTVATNVALQETVLYSVPNTPPPTTATVHVPEHGSYTVTGHHLDRDHIGCSHAEARNIMDLYLAELTCLPMTRQQAAIEAEQRAQNNLPTSIVNPVTSRTVLVNTRAQL